MRTAYRDCEVCGELTGPDGCYCDGHALCAADLHHCPECRAAMRDDHDEDMR